MSESDDRDLRARFEALRREEAQGATSYARIVGTPLPRLITPVRAALAGLAVASATLLVVFAGKMVAPREGVPAQPPLATWREPTAFLLESPTRELLSTVPAFGHDLPPMKTPAGGEPGKPERNPSS